MLGEAFDPGRPWSASAELLGVVSVFGRVMAVWCGRGLRPAPLVAPPPRPVV